MGKHQLVEIVSSASGYSHTPAASARRACDRRTERRLFEQKPNNLVDAAEEAHDGQRHRLRRAKAKVEKLLQVARVM